MNRIRPIGPVGLITVLLLTTCGGRAPQSDVIVSGPSPVPPAVQSPSLPLTGFEGDLQYIRNGQFSYIWVFSRKDGKPLEPSDSDFLRKNAPQVVDWVTTDEGRKVIGGTNFNLEEGNLEALRKRFVAEDYSNK